MCIRDRLIGAQQTAPHLPRALLLDTLWKGWLETALMLDCVCLLYTSDAADERSSVDLGGRRIIKKKKNEDKDRSRNFDIIETDNTSIQLF